MVRTSIWLWAALMAVAGAGSAPVSAAPARTAATIDADLTDVTVAGLERLYKDRRYSVRQVVEWHLARVDRFNPSFKPLVYVYAEEARRRADALDRQRGGRRGALWGVPVVIKANTDIAGRITNVGWEGYVRAGHPLLARRNAHVVDRLLAQGAVIIGHANMPDLAKSDSNVSSVGGRTANAYNPDLSPGGSSGGVAVAVALNMAVVGQGSDTGNSIRNPAANASLVGLLPTTGRVGRSGIHPYDIFRDNTGPMTRTVADAAVALDAMAGPDPDDPASLRRPAALRPVGSFTRFLKPGALKGKRFGVPHFVLEGSPTVRPNPAFWNLGTSPETRRMFLKALEELRAAGATIVIDERILPEAFDRLAGTLETRPYRKEGFEGYLATRAPEGMGSLKALETLGIHFPLERFSDGVTQAHYATDPAARSNVDEPRQKLVAMYRETMRQWRLDGFVYPALQVPANNERSALPPNWPTDGPYSNTGWLNRLQAPAIVVPAGFYPDGTPFGLEFSADLWEDGKLLGWAYAYEQATKHRRAPSPESK